MPSTFCVSQKITECADSPKITFNGTNSTVTKRYEINASSADAALELLINQIAFPIVAGVLLSALPTVRVEPRWNPAVGSGGVGCYSGSIEYRHPGKDEQQEEDRQPGEPGYGREIVSASFSGEQEHITHAISQTHYGALSRDTNRGINVQSNGEVDGVDINKRIGSFTVSTVMDKNICDNDWFRDRMSQIWTTNDDTFRSWPKGCVALAGMEARQRSDGHWEIEYSFQVSPPREAVADIAGVPLTIGGVPQTIDIDGWDYVWVMYQPTDAVVNQAGDEVITPKPIGVHVAQVYYQSDFSDLGILV
jgi:hypothetical protein